MRQTLNAALCAISLTGVMAPVLAQEAIETSSSPAISGEPFDRPEVEMRMLRYDVLADDAAQIPCVSCATSDSDSSFIADSPPCTVFSGRNVDECLAGIDHGGHSKGKYL